MRTHWAHWESLYSTKSLPSWPLLGTFILTSEAYVKWRNPPTTWVPHVFIRLASSVGGGRLCRASSSTRGRGLDACTNSLQLVCLVYHTAPQSPFTRGFLAMFYVHCSLRVKNHTIYEDQCMSIVKLCLNTVKQHIPAYRCIVRPHLYTCKTPLGPPTAQTSYWTLNIWLTINGGTTLDDQET